MSPSAEIKVVVAAEVVVRESDGATLLMVETHAGNRDRPLGMQVFEKPEDER